MTAVEWLQSGLELIMSHEEQMQAIGLFEQAKEMEKEQTIEFANEYSRAVIGGCLLTRTEFYNETFKSE